MTIGPQGTDAEFEAMIERAKTPGERRSAWVFGVICFGIVALLGLDAARGYLFSDRLGDFEHFYDAARAVIKDAHIYQYEEIDTDVSWYAFLPLLAIVLSPLAFLSFPAAGACWAMINAALVGLTLILGGRVVFRRLSIPLCPAPLCATMLIAMLLLSDKINTEFRLGQTDVFIGFWMVLGLVWLDRRPMLSGGALAVATNVKLQGLIFLPYLIVRRRWTPLASLVIGSIGIALGGALIWGWDRNLEYLGTCFGWIGGLAGVTETPTTSELYPLEWNRSVSVPSVVARAQSALGLSSTIIMPAVLAVAGVVYLIGWGLYRRAGESLILGRSGRRDDTVPRDRALALFEWAGLLVAALVFSPQATARHFYLSLFVCIVASAMLVVKRSGVPRLPLLAAAIFYFLSLILPPGGDAFGWLVDKTRAVGVPMWALLTFYFVTLWTGLRWAKTLPSEPSPV